MYTQIIYRYLKKIVVIPENEFESFESFHIDDYKDLP
jgi:hypothetical protein